MPAKTDLVQDAKDAIDLIEADRSVTIEETIERIEEVQSHIEIILLALNN